MKRLIISAIAGLALVAGAPQAEAAPRGSAVQVGRLACDVAPGVGLIIASSKNMTCSFTRNGHRAETYHGTITKVGLDIGVTGRTHIEWLVFAAARTPYRSHALAGDYVGTSGEATVGIGLGGNFLVGGSGRSYALQPFSVQAQTGLNLSVALANLSLH